MDFESWNFSNFKRSAKSLCGLPKEIYNLSKFVKTRTIHITHRQGKIFYQYRRSYKYGSDLVAFNLFPFISTKYHDTMILRSIYNCLDMLRSLPNQKQCYSNSRPRTELQWNRKLQPEYSSSELHFETLKWPLLYE